MKGVSNKVLVIAVVLLLLVNVTMLIFMLKGRKYGHRKMGKPPFERMAEELKMTDQQKTEYKKMKEEHMAAIRPAADSMRAIKKAMFSLVKADNITDSLVDHYSTLLAQQQAVADKATVHHFRKVRALFSGDQQRQFDEFVQKMMQRRRGGPDSANKKPG